MRASDRHSALGFGAAAMLLAGIAGLVRSGETALRAIRKSAVRKLKVSEPVAADERTLLAADVGQGVARLVASLPPETVHTRTLPITFPNEHAVRGRYAILFAGTVVGTPYP